MASACFVTGHCLMASCCRIGRFVRYHRFMSCSRFVSSRRCRISSMGRFWRRCCSRMLSRSRRCFRCHCCRWRCRDWSRCRCLSRRGSRRWCRRRLSQRAATPNRRQSQRQSQRPRHKNSQARSRHHLHLPPQQLAGQGVRQGVRALFQLSLRRRDLPGDLLPRLADPSLRPLTRLGQQLGLPCPALAL